MNTPWWKVWRLPIIVGVVLIAAWFSRHPFLRMAGDWRAARAAETAVEYAEERDWDAAETEARHALQLDRGRIDALRVLVQASFENRRTDTLRIAVNLFGHPDSTAHDKAKVLELLLLSGDLLGFNRLQATLPPGLHRQPDILLQTLRYLTVRGEYDTALRRLQAFLDTGDREDKRFALLQAEILIRAGQPAEARQHIARLVTERGPHSLAAFRLLDLLPYPELDPSAFADSLEWVQSRPDLRTADELLLASLRLRSTRTDEASGAIVRDAIAAFRDADPELLCRWLIRIGRETETRELLDEETGKKSPGLFHLRLRSLLAQGDLDGAVRWLDEAGPLISATEAETLRALVAKRGQDRGKALTHWEAAMREAGIRDNGNLYLKIGRITLDYGEWDWAAEAMLKASRYPETLLPPTLDLTFLVDYLLRQDRAAEAAELTRYWLAREPENPVLRNNLLYMKVLAGDPIENTLEQTGHLRKAFPGMIGFHTTHALALALAGRIGEAADSLSSPNLNWKRATASDLAIRDRILDAADRGGKKTAEREADIAILYPAERRILAEVGGEAPR